MASFSKKSRDNEKNVMADFHLAAPVSESHGLTVTTDSDTRTEVSHRFLNFMISTAGPQWSFCSNKYWQIGLKKDITLNLLVSIAADQEKSEFLHICKFNTWNDLNSVVWSVLLSCQELNCTEWFNEIFYSCSREPVSAIFLWECPHRAPGLHSDKSTWFVSLLTPAFVFNRDK